MTHTFIWDPTAPPLAFHYGGESSQRLLPGWERTERTERHEDGDREQVRFTDPNTKLQATAYICEFRQFDAFEWLLEFENLGVSDTPILEAVWPLDFVWPLAAGESIRLHHAKGSACRMDDFLPMTTELRPKQSIRLAPQGGRSSNGVLPFMNLQWAGGGMVLAIGWSGQWVLTVERNQERLHLCAGMERTHLRLHPGEKIRTPRLLLIPWTGDDPSIGNNRLRRLILQHYTPMQNGAVVMPPVAHNRQYVYYKTNQIHETEEFQAITRTAELGAEAYWLDACWYGTAGAWTQWSQQVGNWQVRTDVFPHGLKPLSDAAHATGLNFVLWLEPERVCAQTHIAQHYPEFLLQAPQNLENLLFNLGLPAALTYMTDFISQLITDCGVDIYRQDFNMDPLPYWQAADAADRVGMTEIRYIEGLYTLWDELRRRHPGLAIDNCASGGRRIDLETISRSYPLWRSDFSDVGGPAHGRDLQIADQSQSAGLSCWAPLHAGPVWTFSPYDFRSALAAGIVPYADVRAADFPREAAVQAIAELKSLRPYFLGDFYPLLPLTVAAHDWCAYQYDRPDLGAGFALFLRRHRSPFPVMEVALQGIDPAADYDVSMTPTFAESPGQRMAGAALVRLAITIPEQPGSLLLRYRPVKSR